MIFSVVFFSSLGSLNFPGVLSLRGVRVMSKPAFYRAPPRWHFFAALVGAVAIEGAAVATGSLLGDGEIPTVIGSGEERVPQGILVEDAPEPEQPPDDPSLIPMPPTDDTDFALVEPTPPPRSLTAVRPKPAVRAHVSRVTGGTTDFGSAQAKMIFSAILVIHSRRGEAGRAAAGNSCSGSMPAAM